MTFNYRQNKLRQIMEKRQKDQKILKAYNKSPEGKKLMDLVRKKHNQERTDPDTLPF